VQEEAVDFHMLNITVVKWPDTFTRNSAGATLLRVRPLGSLFWRLGHRLHVAFAIDCIMSPGAMDSRSATMKTTVHVYNMPSSMITRPFLRLFMVKMPTDA
jgi:hypothetical protein